MASNLVWSTIGLSLEEYLERWKKKSATLNKIKRADFAKLFEQYEKLKLISKNDYDKLDSEFLKTKRQTLNVCPAVKMTYAWPKVKAIELDDRKMFVADVKNNIENALIAWL